MLKTKSPEVCFCCCDCCLFLYRERASFYVNPRTLFLISSLVVLVFPSPDLFLFFQKIYNINRILFSFNSSLGCLCCYFLLYFYPDACLLAPFLQVFIVHLIISFFFLPFLLICIICFLFFSQVFFVGAQADVSVVRRFLFILVLFLICSFISFL